MSTLPRALSIVLAVLTFGLLVLGGVVHATGSSLACPDWPTCYGSLLPSMKGGVLYEHSHRIVATLVVMITLALPLALHLDNRRNHRAGRGALLALGFVGLQASLGGATVLLRLPPVVSLAHLAVGTLFFATTLWLVWELRSSPVLVRHAAPSLRRMVRLALSLAFFQVLLGGLVRHTHSGLSCLGFPGCNAQAWIDWHDARVLVHMAHRLGAVAVALAIIVVAVRARRDGYAQSMQLASVSLALVCVQATLGLMSVDSLLAVWAVTLHLGVGLLLFAVLWIFDLSLTNADQSTAALAAFQTVRQ